MTYSKLDVALIQMTSGPDIGANLAMLEPMIRDAAGQGAQFILTPENTCHMRANAMDKLASSPGEAGHPALTLMAGLAKELQVHILLGSIAVKVSDDKIANRSYLFNSNGDIVAKYDKIHLFDVVLSGKESYKESRLVQPGAKPVNAETDFGKVGLTICYDVRFPYLYRALAKAGASIITVPSAFTVPTGQAHWETLLRARAIETGCFILAPAQTGEHEGGRRTWGHSLIINPWGGVIAQAGDKPDILTARLDLSEVEKARQAIPSLLHDRVLDSL
jgi:predicted amidohydrolase